MDINHRTNQHGPMPVAFFGIAVGSLALAGAWRAAARDWTLPHGLPALLTAGALAVWITLLVAYGHKWLTQRGCRAIEEMRHPVQSSFAALLPVSTMLAAQAVQGYSRGLGTALFVIGVVAQLALGGHGGGLRLGPSSARSSSARAHSRGSRSNRWCCIAPQCMKRYRRHCARRSASSSRRRWSEA